MEIASTVARGRERSAPLPPTTQADNATAERQRRHQYKLRQDQNRMVEAARSMPKAILFVERRRTATYRRSKHLSV